MPDGSVDKVVGEGSAAEISRVAEGVKRAVVLGMARSGQAAAALLERNGVEVVRVDRELGNDEDVSLLEGADVLVKSPGVPRSNAIVAAARIPIWSEVELAAHYLPNPILGVTGTNGKTTTVEWLGAMFRAAGREVAVAGNVGRAIAGVEAPPDAWIVCELSSFQLEDVHELRPHVAVLINLEPDHLDRHGSFEAYRDAKLRIFENQVAEDTAVVPRGFGEVPGEGRRVEFSAADALPAEPGLPGGHNRENAAAATAAARAAGLPDDAIAEALRSFRGCRASARARRRTGRRPVRQRLEGDEHGRRAARARRLQPSRCT